MFHPEYGCWRFCVLLCMVPDCKASRYGPDCSETCECKNGAQCDPRNGRCTCLNSWIGFTCQEGNQEVLHDTCHKSIHPHFHLSLEHTARYWTGVIRSLSISHNKSVFLERSSCRGLLPQRAKPLRAMSVLVSVQGVVGECQKKVPDS